MHLAVLSDIHANLEALQAVWDDLCKRLPESRRTVICLGDMIGYGADPEPVVEFLRERKVRAILGNHEFGVLRKPFRRSFNPVSRLAIEWTAQAISFATRAWLATLPFALSLHNCRFVHGFPPGNPSIYLHEVSQAKLTHTLRSLTEQVCFVGHTHQLRRFELQGHDLKRIPLDAGIVNLRADARHLVNAGAVGQPRDLDPRAAYLLYTPHSGKLEVVRLDYDWQKAAHKIRRAGLPEVYADRLLPELP